MHFSYLKTYKQLNILRILKITLINITFLSSVVWSTNMAFGEKSLVIYSSRQEPLLKALIDQYSQKSGVKIQLHTDSGPILISKLEAENKYSLADVLLTVDAGNLWEAANRNLLQPINSTILNNNVPENLRDPQGRWYALSIRARTIVYNPNLVDKQQLSSYGDLASPKWKNKLCLRTSKSIYNQSLVATLIAKQGKEATLEMLKGWINNLAAKEFANDTNLLKAIASGQCAVGIANSYYLGRLIAEDNNFQANIFWADQKLDGTHINISGAGVTKFAKNREKAIDFIEFMTSDEAQEIVTNIDFEFPIRPQIKKNELIEQWGPFKADKINVAVAGQFQKQAVLLMDIANYK